MPAQAAPERVDSAVAVAVVAQAAGVDVLVAVVVAAVVFRAEASMDHACQLAVDRRRFKRLAWCRC